MSILFTNKFDRVNYYNIYLAPDLVNPNLTTQNIDFLSTKWLKFNEYLQLSNSQTIKHTITDTDQFFPDLVSFNFYGDHNLWWIILLTNGMSNVLTEFTSGTQIQIPTFSSIEIFYQQITQTNSRSQVILPIINP